MQDKKKRLLRGGGRLIALVLLGAVLFAAPWAAETAVTDVKEMDGRVVRWDRAVFSDREPERLAGRAQPGV